MFRNELSRLIQRRGDRAATKSIEVELDRAWVGERSTLGPERL